MQVFEAVWSRIRTCNRTILVVCFAVCMLHLLGHAPLWFLVGDDPTTSKSTGLPSQKLLLNAKFVRRKRKGVRVLKAILSALPLSYRPSWADQDSNLEPLRSQRLYAFKVWVRPYLNKLMEKKVRTSTRSVRFCLRCSFLELRGIRT